jgi:selenide,water dikinase
MAELAQVLRHVVPSENMNALVDATTRDDAAVYRLDDERALVATTDFFTPVVDDPFAFGQIAAANALSDIYAMGATPLFALNLLAFPRKYLEKEWLAEIIRGGAEKCREAGVAILGGHSIDDAEPKYGLVAIGEVHPDTIVRNDAARPGQHLVLTKALGTGIIATAIKAGTAPESTVEEATRSMAALNKDAAAIMTRFGIRAGTDVTGFGLLGHLGEMAGASGLSAELSADAVPLLPGAVELAKTQRFPGGTTRNLADVSDRVEFAEGLEEHRRLLLADAQTSGGLLMAVEPDAVDDLLDALAPVAPQARVIGRMHEGPPGRVRVT